MSNTDPDHYKFWWIEVIDLLKDQLTNEEYEWFLKWNVLKYVLRYKHKNWLEDLKKAQVYLWWLIELNYSLTP